MEKMKEVRARAPGKIIMAGEHAVVHGSTAVAVAIDLFTYISLFPYPASDDDDDDDQLELHLKDMDLKFSWPIRRIKDVLPEVGNADASIPSSCSSETLQAIDALVEEQNIPEANIGLASGVSAFLWLYCSIYGRTFFLTWYKPAKVTVNSDLPLGSGLGSSAAFCVALSAILLAPSDSVELDIEDHFWQGFGDAELELVNKWAFEGEKIIHGNPSGIDNTVSTYGNMVKFKSGEIAHLETTLTLQLLLTNTKVERNTKDFVAGVSERTMRHSDAMSSVFNAVDCISNELAAIITSPYDDGIGTTEKEEKLGELMEMNQGLLQCMGFSHASIETVIQTTSKYKLASKITGAGGGGCVLSILPIFSSGDVVNDVIAELESLGFQCLVAGIAGFGVMVCFNPY